MSCNRADKDKNYNISTASIGKFDGNHIGMHGISNDSGRWYDSAMGDDFPEWKGVNFDEFMCRNIGNSYSTPTKTNLNPFRVYNKDSEPPLYSNNPEKSTIGYASQRNFRDNLIRTWIGPKTGLKEELEAAKFPHMDLLPDFNFDTDYGGNYPQCYMHEPKEENKMACCVGRKQSTLSCGPEWCRSDQKCVDYMDQYCMSGSNLVTNQDCYTQFSNTQGATMSKLCSDQKNFRNPLCKKFCNNQVQKEGEYQSDCFVTAAAYCKAKPSTPECKCINYRSTKAYTEFAKKNGATVHAANYQCWGDPCVGGSLWDGTLTSYSGTCPKSIQICQQNMDLAGLTASSIDKIQSSCSLSSVANTTNNKTTINNTQSTASPDADTGSSAPSSGTGSKPDPVATTAPVPVATTSPDPVTTTAPPNNNNTYMAGGGLFLICCCCCVVVAIIAMMMMSKK